MIARLKSLLRDESGITALETAIILIAFVVVAAVFAFTVLSAGTTSTEKGKEAILAGLQEVSSSLELRGSVLATGNTKGSASTDPVGSIKNIVFTVGCVSGGSAIDLTDTTNSKNTLVIDYRDSAVVKPGLKWSVSWPVRKDDDNLLEDGELAQITIDLTAVANDVTLGTDTRFAIEVKPPRGGILLLEKTTPSFIDAVIDFR